MTWGTVSMVLAPLETIKRFAAWHLELGAARVTLYLDDADPEKAAALEQNPKVTAVLCDAAYWQEQMGKRPEKFQVRQVANATHAYRRSAELDWLAHIDVDEFILPEDGGTVDTTLAAIGSDVKVSRMTMVESLAPESGDIGGQMYFKAFHHDREQRKAATERIYGAHGAYLNGGFLGHLQGKIFVRTRIRDLTFRIHFAGVNGLPLRENAAEGLNLAHFHAPTKALFLSHLVNRLKQGSYQQDNPKAPDSRVRAILRRRELLEQISQNEGETGLAKLFDAIAVAKDPLLSNLASEGLLREHVMDFDGVVAKHFGT